MLAVKRGIAAQLVSLPPVPPAERRRSSLELRRPGCLFLRGLFVMSMLALEPDRAARCAPIEVRDRGASGRGTQQLVVGHALRPLDRCGDSLLERRGPALPE